MTYHRFFLLAFALVTSCTFSSRTHFLGSGSSENSAVDLAAIYQKYEKYDGVYLQIEDVLEHTADKSIMPQWNFYRLKKVRYVVLNPDAEYLTTFAVKTYPNQRLKQVYLKSISPEGQINTYNISHLKTEKESDKSVTYRFVYPNIKKGFVIEEGFEIEYLNLFSNPPLEHEFALQYKLPVEKLKFQYAYPDWWSIRLKNLGAARQLITRTEHNPGTHKYTLVYERDQVEALPDEPFSPFFKEVSNYIELMITELSLGTQTNSNYRSPSNWGLIADQYKSYAVDKSSFLEKVFSTRVKDLSETLTRKCSTDMERLDSIVTYVQSNIEFGTGATTFDELLRKGKGNVYLISGLTQAMLVHAGLDAVFLVVHSANNGYFDYEYISHRQFSGPAVGVKIENRQYVVFPYIKYLPVTLIPEPFRGQQALRVTKEGYQGFLTIPDDSTEDNVSNEKYDVRIDEQGIVSVTEEKVFRGSEAFSIRNKIIPMTDKEREKHLKTVALFTDNDMSDLSLEILNLKNHRESLTIRMKYTISNLVTVTPDEIIFQTGNLLSPSSKIKQKANFHERRNPIKIYYNQSTHKTITIQFPANWTLTTPVKDTDYENRFGKISGRYTIDHGRIQVDQTVFLRKNSDSRETIEELYTLIGGKSQLNVPSLVFSVSEMQ